MKKKSVYSCVIRKPPLEWDRAFWFPEDKAKILKMNRNIKLENLLNK